MHEGQGREGETLLDRDQAKDHYHTSSLKDEMTLVMLGVPPLKTQLTLFAVLWLVLICCERKVLLAGWWLVLVWCERKILLAGCSEQSE